MRCDNRFPPVAHTLERQTYHSVLAHNSIARVARDASWRQFRGATLMSREAGRVPRLEITERIAPTFGGAGSARPDPYECLAGAAFCNINPRHPLNAGIVELSRHRACATPTTCKCPNAFGRVGATRRLIQDRFQATRSRGRKETNLKPSRAVNS